MHKMKLWRNFLFAVFAALLAWSGTGCAVLGLSGSTGVQGEEARAVDYSDADNWVLLPDGKSEMKAVDVFYVYPTVFASRRQPVMQWDSGKIQAKTGNIARQQTGPFASLGNIYAPYVRQAELHRALADLAERPGNNASMLLGVRDTVDAFRYYLKHYNDGRPLILVGHSQGAFDLLELLKQEFREPGLRKKLIAAYLIGCPVTQSDLEENPHLKAAKGPLDLGVIVSWNSEAPEAAPSLFTGRPGTVCINPLNWRTDAVPAAASENLGAVFFDDENREIGEMPGFGGAVVRPETGALIVTPAFPGRYDSSLLGPGIYHMNDIYFFYRNLEANARDRAANYFNTNKQE